MRAAARCMRQECWTDSSGLMPGADAATRPFTAPSILKPDPSINSNLHDGSAADAGISTHATEPSRRAVRHHPSGARAGARCGRNRQGYAADREFRCGTNCRG